MVRGARHVYCVMVGKELICDSMGGRHVQCHVKEAI